MRHEFKGFTKVFSFTFEQHIKGKNFKTTLIAIALLCLLVPPLVMGLMEKTAKPASETETGTDMQQAVSTQITEVTVADMDTAHEMDYSMLNQTGSTVFSNITYKKVFDLAAAKALTTGENALILMVTYENGSYDMEVLIPEQSIIDEEDAKMYAGFLSEQAGFIQMAKAGVTAEQLSEVSQALSAQTADDAEAGETDADGFGVIRSALSFILPYVTIMALYFMILSYGTGVANNVIQEKSSKLMDNLLVSVRPAALVMGKVLALFCSGVLQTLIWVVSLVGGFAIGVQVVQWINPQSDMLLLQFIKSLGAITGIFNITGIIFALFIFLAGFLLYCALASVGGSLASKQEELNSTNMLFAMVLVFSFIAALMGGVLEGNITDWMLYVPFTAVLVAPGQALLGELTLLQGSISLAVLLVTDLVVIWLAGKLYQMMALYKGNIPSVGKIFLKIVKR